MSIAVKFHDTGLGMIDSDLGPVLLDTGCPTALVSETFAAQHRVRRLGRKVSISDVVGGRAQAELAIIERLQIPATEPGKFLELRDIKTVVFKDVGAFFKRIDSPLVLGMPVFEGRVVQLDYPASKIRILRRLPFGLNCTRVPLSTADYGGDGVPGIPVQIEGMEPTRAVLDSGYSEFFTFGADIWKKLPLHEGSRHIMRGGGILKYVSYERALSEARITVGNLSFHGAPVERANGRTWEDNIVGASVLCHTTVAIDWSNKRAVFTSPSPVIRKRWVKVTETPSIAGEP